MNIQCGGAGRAGGTGGTRRGRGKGRREGNEAQKEGASRCRPRANRRRQRTSQEDLWGAHRQVVHDTEYENKEQTVKYVPTGRVADW